MNIFGEEEKMKTHCIIVEHGTLMEGEKRTLLIYGKTLFPLSKFVVLMFLSYSHCCILFLKLDLNIFE